MNPPEINTTTPYHAALSRIRQEEYNKRQEAIHDAKQSNSYRARLKAEVGVDGPMCRDKIDSQLRSMEYYDRERCAKLAKADAYSIAAMLLEEAIKKAEEEEGK